MITVPSALPRLAESQALAAVVLPVHLNWWNPGRRFDLAERSDRARVYEIVLREGGADDILTYIDGALLVDLWDDLVLSRDIRTAWDPLILLAGPPNTTPCPAWPALPSASTSSPAAKS